VLEGVKQMLARWFGGERRAADDQANQPPGPADQGAGMRHGQAPS